MARNQPVRTTEDLHLTIARALGNELRVNSQRLGLTVSEYIATLAQGQTPVARPGAEMQDVSLAGNRVVRAIAALGGSSANVDEAIRLLRDAQHLIAAELRKAQPAYEAAVAAQVRSDMWGDG